MNAYRKCGTFTQWFVFPISGLDRNRVLRTAIAGPGCSCGTGVHLSRERDAAFLGNERQEIRRCGISWENRPHAGARHENVEEASESALTVHMPVNMDRNFEWLRKALTRVEFQSGVHEHGGVVSPCF